MLEAGGRVMDETRPVVTWSLIVIVVLLAVALGAYLQRSKSRLWPDPTFEDTTPIINDRP
jgi:hypothetical protein